MRVRTRPRHQPWRRLASLLVAVAIVGGALAVLAPSQAAAQCSTARLDADPDTRNLFEWSGKLDQVVASAESSASAPERANAVLCMAEFPPRQSQAHLLDALDDSAPEVKVAALEALRLQAARDAIDRIALELDANDAEVRTTAAQTLGSLGARSKVNRLVSALSDPSADVKQAAIVALGEIRDPAAIEPLTSMLAEDSRDVVVATLEVLGTFGDRTTVYDVLEKTRDNSKAVRIAAVKALGALGDPRATMTLVGMLRGQPDDVRRQVVRAIGQIGDPVAVESLLAMLGEDDLAVSSVVRALGELGDERAVEPLLAVLRHGEHGSAVRSALVKIGPAAVPTVVDELQRSEDHEYQKALLLVLGQLPSTEAAAVLEDALVSGRYPRADVVMAIANAREPEMLDLVTLVLPELNDRDLGKVLARTRDVVDDRVIAPLVTRYPNAGARTRLDLLLTFAAVGDAAALPVVIEEIGNDDLEIQRLAVHAAQSIGSPDAVDALAGALRSDDSALRRQASVALAVIGGPAAIDKLLAVARDVDHPARRSASWALAFAVRDTEGEARDKVERFAREVLEEPGHTLTYTALDSFGTLGLDGLSDELATIYDQGRVSVRRKVLEMVGAARYEAGGPLVDRALAEAVDEALLAEAAWAAGQLRLESATPRLVALADSTSPAVATNAIDALAMLGNTDALDTMQRRLYDTSPFVVAASIRALHALGATPDDWEIELVSTRSSNPFLREIAYRTLLDAGYRETFESVMKRERNAALLATMTAVSGGTEEVDPAADDWLVLDVSQGKLDRAIAERVYLMLPDGRIKAAFSDENGKIRLELDAPGRVRQLYDSRPHVPFPTEPEQ